jgi:hypothetical protein
MICSDANLGFQSFQWHTNRNTNLEKMTTRIWVDSVRERLFFYFPPKKKEVLRVYYIPGDHLGNQIV